MSMSEPPSPVGALIPLAATEPDWQPIFQGSSQVVLYNPTSHALSIRHPVPNELPVPSSGLCPYCSRPLPSDFEADSGIHGHTPIEGNESPVVFARASNYFQLLAVANETSSRPSTPPLQAPEVEPRERSSAFPPEAMAEGYFKAFFREECRLGMGANGSVFLCQVCEL
jgi:hypothetical protein